MKVCQTLDEMKMKMGAKKDDRYLVVLVDRYFLDALP
jgi:hypothetical protein